MRILLLTRYDRRGASSRLRLLQFIPHLEQFGLSVSTDCLFDASYLDALYAGKRDPGAILRAYRRRLAGLKSARRADLIWLEKEALPWIRSRITCTPKLTTETDGVFMIYGNSI